MRHIGRICRTCAVYLSDLLRRARWRAILTGASTGAAVMALVVSLYLDQRLAEVQRANDLLICHTTNQNRRESNRRAVIHERQARNLEELIRTLTHTRHEEFLAARTYPEPWRTRLTHIYLVAQRKDSQFLAVERRVRYGRLALIDCRRVIRTPAN